MTQKTEEKTHTNPEYKNDHIHVVVHKKPHCVVEYEVEVYRSICNDAYKTAAKKIGKEVAVPGFRKGKAPPEMVAKKYPHDLDRVWQEEIANHAYREAAKLANVAVINKDAKISFKMEKHNTEGAKLTLSFETVPNIPSVDPAKCVLKEVKRPEVSKEKVEETIRQTQLFFAEWGTANENPVKKGDFVLLDVEVIEEDPPQKLFNNTRFEVVDKSMAQWMQKLILGKKVDDVLEGISTPDKDATEEEKADFPPKKVRVTIKAIETAKLPELDDPFAKQLGVESVDALRQRVEEILNKKADEHVREQKREKVTEFLLSHHFALPFSVIEKETRFRLEQMIQDPNFKARWDRSNDQERRAIVDEVKNQAEKAVRIFYLCRKIAADQNMPITAKDLPQGAADKLEALLFPYDQHHDPRQPDIKQAEAYSRALLEKTEDWVIAHARVGSAEPEKKEEKSKAAAPKESKPKRKTAAKKTATAGAKKAAEKPKKKATPKPKKDKA